MDQLQIESLLNLRQVARDLNNSEYVSTNPGLALVPRNKMDALHMALADVCSAFDEEKPTTYTQGDNQFTARLRARSKSRLISADPEGKLERLLPVICAARPFVYFPDSYSSKDVDELAKLTETEEDSGHIRWIKNLFHDRPWGEVRKEIERLSLARGGPTPDEHIVAITELFHPDMNYSDIKAATVTLLQLRREVALVTQELPPRRRGFVLAAFERCSRALWEGRKTQLEIDEEPPKSSPGAPTAFHAAEESMAEQDKEALRAIRSFFAGEQMLWPDVAREVARLVAEDNERRSRAGYDDLVRLKMVDPIPMLLFCPMCHTRHIDEGEFATRKHHTHACQGHTTDADGKRRRCGNVWRPAIVPTVGVEALPGFLNEAPGG